MNERYFSYPGFSGLVGVFTGNPAFYGFSAFSGLFAFSVKGKNTRSR